MPASGVPALALFPHCLMCLVNDLATLHYWLVLFAAVVHLVLSNPFPRPPQLWPLQRKRSRPVWPLQLWRAFLLARPPAVHAEDSTGLVPKKLAHSSRKWH